MERFVRIFKRIAFVTTAVLAGLFLYFLQLSFDMNHNLLTSGFHKNLFVKNDIYRQTYNVINTSMTEFVENLKSSSPSNFQEYSSIFNVLEQSMTPELVTQNLDSVRDGLINYFKGEKKTLPDIYLNSNIAKGDAESKGSEEQTTALALASVDRINLGAILLYIDRNDINDRFNLLKAVYFLFDRLSSISLVFLALLLTCGMLCISKSEDVFCWFKFSLVFAGIFFIVSGISSAFYGYFFLPGNIYPISMSLPLPLNIIIAYLRDFIFHLSIFQVSAAVVTFLLVLLIARLKVYLSKLLHSLSLKGAQISTYAPRLSSWFLSAVCLLVLAVNIQSAYTFKKDFDAKDFPRIIGKNFLASTVTKIIPATEDNIYLLEIYVKDEKTAEPVSNIPLGIAGRSKETDRFISLSGSTDHAGRIRFNVEPGNFRLSFFPTLFSTKYLIPSSLFLEVSASGVTQIEIGLEPAEEAKAKPGIIELEILDRENSPVPGLEAVLVEGITALGSPNKILSSTNNEGIAVFKVNPGEYVIKLNEDKLPKKYSPPPAFKITLSSDGKVRYTYRLSESKKP